MICKNCEREIPNQPTCPFCGYNKKIDSSPYVVPKADSLAFPPQKLEIKYIATNNGKAKTALAFAFIGLVPGIGIIFWILSFIFALVGLGQVKRTHNGKPQAIAALIIDICVIIFWVIAYIVIIGVAINTSSGRHLIASALFGSMVL